MNYMFSIKKEYADLIFNEIKPFDFRNVCPNLDDGDKVYLYEIKSSGCGKVVGYFIVENISKIPHSKIGTYLYIDTYAKMFCDEKIQESVNKAKQVEFEDYYNSYVLDFLFKDDLIEEMIKTHKPPIIDYWKMNQDEMKEYNLIKQKQTDFCQTCDEWLKKIGFYNEYDESTWKYQINIKNVVKFEKPIDVNKFQLRNGNYITNGPQNFYYIKNDIL